MILNAKCSKWFFWIRLTDYLFTGIRIDSFHCFNIHRRRQVTANRIQCSLYTFIFK